MASRLRHLFRPRPVANNGSQLRDHLANERTFLSWTRMGLAFGALALGLGRLGLIDHLIGEHWGNERTPSATQAANSNTSGEQRQDTGKKAEVRLTGGHDIAAANLCWVISSWSFGYGILRYLSIRRNLLSGTFVPAIWGPVLVTCGSVGALGILAQGGNGYMPGTA